MGLRTNKFRPIAVTAAIFAATWLLWSGLYQPLLLGLGALSCLLVVVVAWRTGFFESEFYAFHFGPRLPKFWLWLLKEIAKANVTVARIVLDPRLPIAPTVVTVDANELPPVVQVTFANSITLTPGTLTLDINRGRIEVHCLTAASAAELERGEMQRRARELAGR